MAQKQKFASHDWDYFRRLRDEPGPQPQPKQESSEAADSIPQNQKFISHDWDYFGRREEPRPASISEPRLPSREDDEEQRRRDVRTGLAAPSSPSFSSRPTWKRQLLSPTQLPNESVDLESLIRFGKAAVVEPVKGL